MKKLLIIPIMLFMSGLLSAVDIEQSTVTFNKLVGMASMYFQHDGSGVILSSSPFLYGGGGGGSEGTTIDDTTFFIELRCDSDLYVSSLTAQGVDSYYFNFVATITEVTGYITYMTTNAPIVCDLHIYTSSAIALSTSVWTTQANRLLIDTTQQVSTPNTTFDYSLMPKGSSLSLQVDSCGNTTDGGAPFNPMALPGSYLKVIIKGKRTFNQ